MNIINQQKLNQMKKKLKHQQHLKDLKQQQFIKYKKQIEYQLKNDQVPLLAKLAYQPYVITKEIHQNYDELITKRVKLLSNPKWTKANLYETNKDNRTILANLNYVDMAPYNKKLHLYGGIVTGYRVVKEKLYLLISSVHAFTESPMTVERKNFNESFRFATDHLWIGIHQISFDRVKNDSITIGLGDCLTFLGEVNAYRGKKENIRQTKFGVYNTIIIDSGYPSFLLNHPYAPQPNDYTWNIAKPVHYQHQSYLVKFTNLPQNNKYQSKYGSQFDLEKMS